MIRRRTGWRTGVVAVAATASLVGTVGAPAASAAETRAPFDITIGGTSLRDLGIDITKLDPSNPDLSGIDFQKVLGLLDNPAVAKLVESCRTGALGTGGGGANVDCGGATGTGAAMILPGRIDLASIADQVTIDLGPRAGALGFYVPMGVQTPFGILSVLAAKPTGLAAIGLGLAGLSDIDPFAMGRYQTLDQIKAAAALPVVMQGIFIRTDKNLAARTEALKIASLLTGVTYDYTKPTIIDAALPNLIGKSTILGDGFTFALAMNGGTALARTKNKLALALAGADGVDATSNAYADLGLALALNMNTSKVGLDWFGTPLSFDKIQDSKVIERVLTFAKNLNMLPAGLNIDAATINELMDTVDKLKLPDLKEVSCLGVGTSASSSGLGECSNTLGLFDYYKDLRTAKDGQSRQTQWGLTDPTSLFLGKGNALSQVLTPGVLQLLTAVAGGDLSKVPFTELTGLMENPFVKDAIAALLSEEKRLKVTNDFLRLTKDVRTTETSHAVVDENGAPVLDENGKPRVDVSSTTTTSYLLTSDYGLRSPITVDWMGYRLTVFPSAEVNGTVRPNYLGLPTITKIDGAAPSLLPRVGLIELANPFGLGTIPITPLAPFTALDSWIKSVTIKDDVERIGTLIPLAQQALGGRTPAAAEPAAPEAPVAAAALAAPADDAPGTVVTSGGAPANPAISAESGPTVTPAAEASETGAPDAPSTGSTTPPETETSPEPAAEAPATAAEATVEPETAEADTVDTDTLETTDAA
ncbi:hypothetical protein [Tsukamurella hominis]|uniref:hypothetical protein n=1 Tax=Tsukamurella hominis TaxID=1970232 RepID=UPI0039E98D27